MKTTQLMNRTKISSTVGSLQKSGLVGQLLGLQPDVDVHLQHLGNEIVEDCVIASHRNVCGDVAKSVYHFAGTTLVTAATFT